MRSLVLAALASSPFAAGCASDDGASTAGTSGIDDGGGGGGTGTPQADPPFASLCAGRLLKSQRLMVPATNSPGGWDSSSETAPVGTVFLVGINMANTFGGFVVSGAAPRKIAEASLSTGLVAGIDFESSCATIPATASKTFVVLAPSTLHGDRALSGTPCTVAAGTEFGSPSFSSGVPASLTSTELRTRCGFSPGYSKDLVFGFVVKK